MSSPLDSPVNPGSPTGVLTILMTAPDPAVAEAIVRQLIKDDLIACGNIIDGVRSIYRWQGKVQQDREVMVVMKSTQENVDRLLTAASSLHPYDVPELLVVDVVAGNPLYLEWVRNECR